jgi:hypothetical protein
VADPFVVVHGVIVTHSHSCSTAPPEEYSAAKQHAYDPHDDAVYPAGGGS